jgi:hypothetical protein
VNLGALAILSADNPIEQISKMMFELIAAAVVAAFVSCLYPIVRGFFRDLGEIGTATSGLSHLATARRSVNRNLDGKKHNATLADR